MGVQLAFSSVHPFEKQSKNPGRRFQAVKDWDAVITSKRVCTKHAAWEWGTLCCSFLKS